MARRNRLYLVRHGQINGHEHNSIHGHTEIGLTETGVLQMQHLSERLRFLDIKAIFASDLERSAAGARWVARYHEAPVELVPELREMYFGEWEGLTLEEVCRRFPEALAKRQADLVNFSAPGGGESMAGFAERVLSWLKRRFVEQGPGDWVLVAHGGVNRVIICDALGLSLASMYSLQQDYGCLNIIDYFDDGKLVRLMNG
ncbi:putative alpha-ribazole phosphatase [uncultured Desulfatiglans sp.]|nr:putative alpha-ribazole phosphatase [uncultured Desulfatiglans sp.]